MGVTLFDSFNVLEKFWAPEQPSYKLSDLEQLLGGSADLAIVL